MSTLLNALLKQASDDWAARADRHIRSELVRLGVDEDDAPDRVVLVQRRHLLVGPGSLPEVWLLEDWEAWCACASRSDPVVRLVWPGGAP